MPLTDSDLENKEQTLTRSSSFKSPDSIFCSEGANLKNRENVQDWEITVPD